MMIELNFHGIIFLSGVGLAIFTAGYGIGIVDATDGLREDECERTIVDMPWRMIRRMSRSRRRNGSDASSS